MIIFFTTKLEYPQENKRKQKKKRGDKNKNEVL